MMWIMPLYVELNCRLIFMMQYDHMNISRTLYHVEAVENGKKTPNLMSEKELSKTAVEFGTFEQ